MSARRNTALATALCLLAGEVQAGELSALLQATLAHPSISAAHAGIDSAQQQRRAAGAAYFGSGTAGLDAASYESARFLGVLNPPAFADPAFARTQWRYGARYAVPVDLSGAIAATRAAATQDLRLAELNARQQTLLKLHETLQAYAALQALTQQAATLRVQQARVAQTVARVEVQVDSGALGRSDLMQARSEQARLEAERIRLEGERTQWQAVLQDSSAQSLAQLVTAADANAGAHLPLPEWSGTESQALPEQLADAARQRDEAQARAAHRALWPALSAGVDYYQWQGGGRDQESWTLGARLSLPIDPAAQLRAGAADAQVRAASDAVAAAQRRVQRERASLHASYQAARADMAALDKEIDYRREIMAVQDELVEVGAQSVEDSLRHERERVEAVQRRTNAQVQAVLAWSAAQVLDGVSPEQYIARLAD